MTAPTYSEPQVSFLVLDYAREAAARACLQSIRDHVKIPTRVIYCHNGAADYPLDLLRAGLIDDLIMPRENGGLGLGTRALFAACFSHYAVYWQVDQIMGRDFTQREVNALAAQLVPALNGGRSVKSVSLAGAVCGSGTYSERAHFIQTAAYQEWEHELPLTHGGAGPWAHVMWREEQIQRLYRENGWEHCTDWPQLAIDNGRDAVRQNPDGSRWKHFPDTKQLWLLSGPVKERYVYPKLDDKEWEQVLGTQTWPGGQVPVQERKDSFHVWN